MRMVLTALHIEGASVMRRIVAILCLLTVSSFSLTAVREAHANASCEICITRAVDYLASRFNPVLGLIYESDDPGNHWLRDEFHDFKWRYRQTYWLYSDNLFAAYALEPFRPDLTNRIMRALQRYQVPPSGLFEIVAGDTIPTIRNAVDYIVDSSSDFVIMARRHDSPIISYGLYADLICYRSLQMFLQGRIREAHRSLRQAISLWNGKGLDDWSYRLVDGYHSNQKLALLLYSSRILGLGFASYAEMERHLWGMQRADGGLASLSDSEGRPMGSSNAETTALTLLIYNNDLVHTVRSRVQSLEGSFVEFYLMSFTFLSVTAAAFLSSRKRGFFRFAENRQEKGHRIARRPEPLKEVTCKIS